MKMGIKDAQAKMIAKMMKPQQKKDAIQKFYEINKEKENIDELVKEMKKLLGYEGDDVPKK